MHLTLPECSEASRSEKAQSGRRHLIGPFNGIGGMNLLELEVKSTKGEKRLEALAKKKTKVKVTGKKSGNTLEVSQLKTTKGKQKK